MNSTSVSDTFSSPQVTLISPREYYGAMVELIKERRGSELEVTYLDDGSVSIGVCTTRVQFDCD